MDIITKQFENNLKAFVLKNPNGMSATIINFGAAIAGIEVPDRNGNIADVTLGHDNLLNFIGGRYYLGATVGRYANRIAAGEFSLEGKKYNVSINKGGNLLHGGFEGFDKKYWKTEIIDSAEGQALELTLISPDGEEGFPGRMEVKVVYTVTRKNELKIEYSATSDKPTVINLTNHCYFNLTGTAANSVLDHILQLNADSYIPYDEQFIPTGEIEKVKGLPLDFRKPYRIGDRIDNNFGQLELAKGYDQNLVLNNFDGGVRQAATLYEQSSGRFMEVYTDQPGIQFYTGNYLDGTMIGKNGIEYQKRSGLCLECQHFPNSPNEPKFPSTVLFPSQLYRQTTIYKFSVH
jgi:aldose 1-epimerase